MNEKKLILIGGGGHCKAVIDVALSADYTIMGILDNALEKGSTVLGIPVIGSDDDIKSIVEQYKDNIEFVISVGQIKSSAVRRALSSKVIESGGAIASPIVAATAHIARGAKLGRGTVVMHNAIVNSDAAIGENCIINTGAIVEHDCKVGNFIHISTGAIVNGTASIGDNAFIGSHATIANNIIIASNTVIGTGATVINDIYESGTYCGIPAKPIRND